MKQILEVFSMQYAPAYCILAYLHTDIQDVRSAIYASAMVLLNVAVDMLRAVFLSQLFFSIYSFKPPFVLAILSQIGRMR